MILYYITDRTQFDGDEAARYSQLLDKIEEAARAEVDYIQLRERDLAARAVEQLARQAMARIAKCTGTKTRLLINSRLDVAIAVGADGVHLRADDVNAGDARAVFGSSPGYKSRAPVIAVSCHSAREVALAESFGADFAVLGPLFEKQQNSYPTLGLTELERACHREAAAASRMPVLALGGVTAAKATNCIAAGAAGVAGIRLFQSNHIGNLVRELRGAATRPEESHKPHPYWGRREP